MVHGNHLFMMYHQLMLSELGEKECHYAGEENGSDLLYVEDVCEYLWENGMNEGASRYI